GSPACTGSLTKSRATIGGAGRSTGSSPAASIAAPPSMGRPSGSTMRPSSPSPTGTLATSPVLRTTWSASTPSASSSSTQPTEFRSSVSTKPICPCSNRTNSFKRTSRRPETLATPSPTEPTRPISSVVADSTAAPTRRRASSSQPSSSAVWRATEQLLADTGEIAAPGIAQNRRRTVQFETGNQRRIVTKGQRQVEAERLRDHVVDQALLVVGQYRCGHDDTVAAL